MVCNKGTRNNIEKKCFKKKKQLKNVVRRNGCLLLKSQMHSIDQWLRLKDSPSNLM